MQTSHETVQDRLARKGVSRRDFLKLCGLAAGALALPVRYVDRIAQALAQSGRLPVVWLEFQDCTGDTESFLRASAHIDPLQPGVTDPGLTDLLLDVISVEYHETIMAPAGFQAEASLDDVLAAYPGQFVAVVEGAIPAAGNGVYCTIGGRTALDRAQQVLPQARAVIAMGSCAWDGGLAAAAPNPTGAVGVKDAVTGLPNLLALPGCPANVVNLVASMVYLLTFDQLPDHDSLGRPYFAYGQEIHDRCERKDFEENDQYVLAWGDEGHQKGWCLKKMGCCGPETHSNCYKELWNDGTSWPIRAGHPCIGCTESRFWDRFAPFYSEHDD